ncbi:MAG: hypothetical protein M3393_09525 [Actinomycetota bacterium]|nr:hypothetical protein [Actinomycetota bacterium]
MTSSHVVTSVDPFDLPDWLGSAPVVWTARSSVRGAHLVTGALTGATGEHERSSDDSIACDLLAADLAYPGPVLEDRWRRAAHQAWTHAQVLLVEYDGRLTLAVPGSGFTADLVLETLSRLAKAVGVSPEQFVAALQL